MPIAPFSADIAVAATSTPFINSIYPLNEAIFYSIDAQMNIGYYDTELTNIPQDFYINNCNNREFFALNSFMTYLGYRITPIQHTNPDYWSLKIDWSPWAITAQQDGAAILHTTP